MSRTLTRPQLEELDVDALRAHCEALQRDLRRCTREAEAARNEARKVQEVAERNRAMMYKTHQALSDEIEVRRRSEDALREAMEAATEAARTKDAFLNNMSHELRTPMNAIVGLLELMEGDLEEKAQRSRARMARRSADRLLLIIGDVLELARDAGEQAEPLSEVFDPREVLDTVIEPAFSTAREQDLEVSLQVSDDLPNAVAGDPVRLRQVLRHLLDNAVKFTAAGRISVSVDFRHGALDIVVQDTGVGISSERLEAVYEPFVQEDVSSTRRFGGTGLGLAIVRRLLDTVGGRMELRSEVDAGTHARCSFPVLRVSPTRRVTASAPVGGADLSALRVLLVEDNPVNQKVFELMAQRLGVTCEIAENGEIAVEMVAQRDYSLVFMDCQMPVMDGYEATRQIRSTEDGRDLRIVALTAHVQPADRRRCLEAGMDDHLTKPVTLERLREALTAAAASHTAPLAS